MCDQNYGHCVIFNESFEREGYIEIPGREHDRIRLSCATVLSSGEIVINLPAERKLFIASWNGKRAIASYAIELPHVPRVLHGLNNGDLAVPWSNPTAFGIISQSSWSHNMKVFFDRDRAGRIFKSFDYMAIDEKRSRVVQPCAWDRAVYCFDFKGNPQYKYKNPFIRIPGAVALDGDGNAYMCDVATSSIHVISVDGMYLHVIRGDNCPQTPQTIAFLKDGRKFLVAQKHNLWEFQLKTPEDSEVICIKSPK